MASKAYEKLFQQHKIRLGKIQEHEPELVSDTRRAFDDLYRTNENILAAQQAIIGMSAENIRSKVNPYSYPDLSISGDLDKLSALGLDINKQANFLQQQTKRHQSAQEYERDRELQLARNALQGLELEARQTQLREKKEEEIAQVSEELFRQKLDLESGLTTESMLQDGKAPRYLDIIPKNLIGKGAIGSHLQAAEDLGILLSQAIGRTAAKTMLGSGGLSETIGEGLEAITGPAAISNALKSGGKQLQKYGFQSRELVDDYFNTGSGTQLDDILSIAGDGYSSKEVFSRLGDTLRAGVNLAVPGMVNEETLSAALMLGLAPVSKVAAAGMFAKDSIGKSIELGREQNPDLTLDQYLDRKDLKSQNIAQATAYNALNSLGLLSTVGPLKSLTTKALDKGVAKEAPIYGVKPSGIRDVSARVKGIAERNPVTFGAVGEGVTEGIQTALEVQNNKNLSPYDKKEAIKEGAITGAISSGVITAPSAIAKKGKEYREEQIAKKQTNTAREVQNSFRADKLPRLNYDVAVARYNDGDISDIEKTANTMLANAHKPEANSVVNQAIKEIKEGKEKSDDPFVQAVKDKILSSPRALLNVLSEDEVINSSSISKEAKDTLENIAKARQLDILDENENISNPKKLSNDVFTPLNTKTQEVAEKLSEKLLDRFKEEQQKDPNLTALQFLQNNKVKGKMSLMASMMFIDKLQGKDKAEIEEILNKKELEKEEKKREKEKEERKVKPLDEVNTNSISSITNEAGSLIPLDKDYNKHLDNKEKTLNLDDDSNIDKVESEVIVQNTIKENYSEETDKISYTNATLTKILGAEKSSEKSTEEKTARFTKVVKAVVAKALKDRKDNKESAYKQGLIELANAISYEAANTEDSEMGSKGLEILFKEISDAGLLTEVAEQYGTSTEGATTTTDKKTAKEIDESKGSEANRDIVVTETDLNTANIKRKLKETDAYIKTSMSSFIGLQRQRQNRKKNIGIVEANQWQNIKRALDKILILLNKRDLIDKDTFTNTLNRLYDRVSLVLQDISTKRRALETAFMKVKNDPELFKKIQDYKETESNLLFFKYSKTNPTEITILSKKEADDLAVGTTEESLIEKVLNRNTLESDIKYGYLTHDEITQKQTPNELTLIKSLNEQEKNIRETTKDIRDTLDEELSSKVETETAPIVSEGQFLAENDISSAKEFITRIGKLKESINTLKRERAKILKNKSLTADQIKTIEGIKSALVERIKEYDTLLLTFKKGLYSFSAEEKRAIEDFLSLGSLYSKISEASDYVNKLMAKIPNGKDKAIGKLLASAREILQGFIRQFNEIAASIVKTLGFNPNNLPNALKPIEMPTELSKATKAIQSRFNKGIALDNLGEIEGKYKYSNPELAKEAKDQMLNINSDKVGFLKLLEPSKALLSKVFNFSHFKDKMYSTDEYNKSFSHLVKEISGVEKSFTEDSDLFDLYEKAKDGKSGLKTIYAEALAVAYAIFNKEIQTISTQQFDDGKGNKLTSASENLEVKLAKTFMDVLEVQFSKKLTNKEIRDQVLQTLGSSLNGIILSSGIKTNPKGNSALSKVASAVDKSMFKDKLGYHTSRLESIQSLNDKVDNGLFRQSVSWFKKSSIYKMATQGFNIFKTGVTNTYNDILQEKDMSKLVELFLLKNSKTGSIFPLVNAREKEFVVDIAYTPDVEYNLKYIRDFIANIDDSDIQIQLKEFVDQVTEAWGLGRSTLNTKSVVTDTDNLVSSHSARLSNSLREFIEMLGFTRVNENTKSIYLQIDLQNLMRTSNTKFQSNKDMRNILHLGSNLSEEQAKELNEKTAKDLGRDSDPDDFEVNNFMLALNSMDIFTPSRKSPADIVKEKQSLLNNDYVKSFYDIVYSDKDIISKAIDLWKLLDDMGERPYSLSSMINVLSAFNKSKEGNLAVDYTRLQIWIDASAQGSAVVNTLMGITKTQRDIAEKSGLGLSLISMAKEGSAAFQKVNLSEDNYHEMMRLWFRALFSGVVDAGKNIMSSKLSDLFGKDEFSRKDIIDSLTDLIYKQYGDKPVLARLMSITIKHLVPKELTKGNKPISGYMTLEDVVMKTKLKSSARNLVGKWLLMLINYGSTNVNNSGKMILNASNEAFGQLMFYINGHDKAEGENHILSRLFRDRDVVNKLFETLDSESNMMTVLRDNNFSDITEEQLDDIQAFLFLMKNGLDIADYNGLQSYIGKGSKGLSAEDVDKMSHNLGEITSSVVNDAISAATGYSEEILSVTQKYNYIKNYSLLYKWVNTLLKNRGEENTSSNVSKYINTYKEGKNKGFYVTNLQKFSDKERQEAFDSVVKNIQDDKDLKDFFGIDFLNTLSAVNVIAQIKEDTDKATLDAEDAVYDSTPSLTGERIKKSVSVKYYVEFGTTYAPSIGQESDSYIIDRIVNALSAKGINFWHVFDSIGTNVAEADEVTAIANEAVKDLITEFDNSRLYKSMANLETAWNKLSSEIPEIGFFAYGENESSLDNNETITKLTHQATALAARLSMTINLFRSNEKLLDVNMFDSGIKKIGDYSSKLDPDKLIVEDKPVVTTKEQKGKKEIEEYDTIATKTELLLNIGRKLGLTNTLNFLDNSTQLKQLVQRINQVLTHISDLGIPFEKTFLAQKIPDKLSQDNIWNTESDDGKSKSWAIISNIRNAFSEAELNLINKFFSSGEALLDDTNSTIDKTSPLFELTKRETYKKSIKESLKALGIPDKIAQVLASHIAKVKLSPDKFDPAVREAVNKAFPLAKTLHNQNTKSIPNVIKAKSTSTIPEGNKTIEIRLDSLNELIKDLTDDHKAVLRKLAVRDVLKNTPVSKLPSNFISKDGNIIPLQEGDILSIFAAMSELDDISKATKLLQFLGVNLTENGDIANKGSDINITINNSFGNQIPPTTRLLSELKETVLSEANVITSIPDYVPASLETKDNIVTPIPQYTRYVLKDTIDVSFGSEKDINLEEAVVESIIFDVSNATKEDYRKGIQTLLKETKYTNSSADWITSRVEDFIAPFAEGTNITVAKVRGVASAGKYFPKTKQISLYLSNVSNNNMSPVELFAHESTHAVLDYASGSTDPIVVNALSEMQDIQKRFLSYARSHSAEIAKQLGVSEEVFKDKYISYMQEFEEFGAIINSNEKLWNVLNNIPYKISLGQRFFNLMKIISNAIFGTNFVLDGLPSAERFDKLYLSLARASSNLQTSYNGVMVERQMRSLFNYVDKKVAPIAKIPFRLWGERVTSWLDKELQKTGKISKVKAGLYAFASIPVLNRRDLGERLVEVLRRSGTDGNIMQSLTSHALGIDKVFSEDKGASMQIDTLRNNAIAAYKETMKQAVGRELSIPEQQALTRSLKRTDITSLPSIEEMIKALNDVSGSFIQGQIDEAIRNIKSLSGGDATKLDYILTSSKNLAHFMVTEEVQGYFLSNPANIARTLTLSPDAVIKEDTTVDIPSLTAHIDKLVTYYALKETDKADLDVLRTLPEENLRKTLEVVKEVNDKARQDIYRKGGDVSNYVKGYVKTPASKSFAVRIGTRDKTEYMSNLGYKAMEGYSPLRNVILNDLTLFYSTTEFNQAFNMGALRTVSNKTRGYTLGAYLKAKYPDKTSKELEGLTLAKIKEISTVLADHRNPNWKGSNILPIFDSKGRVSDFRLTIPRNIKEQIGLVEPSIFDAIGDEMGNLLDKELSLGHNEQMVNNLETYYKEIKSDPTKKHIHFVTISANPLDSNSSLHPDKIEEMWNSMSQPLKDHIINRYGGKLHIRSDLLATIMGYKDFRLISDDLDPERVLPDNQVRRLLRFIEASAYKLGSWNKSRVVLKNPKTVWNNIKSNIFIMSTFDYPVSKLLPDVMLSVRNLEAYNADMKKKALLLAKRSSATDPKSIDRQIAFLDDKWKNSSIKALDNRGLYSDIVNDDSFESEIGNPDIFEKYIDKGFSYITNDFQRNALKEAVMTNDSQGFALMKKVFTYSDMVFKDVAYQYLTKEKKMSKDQALDTIERSFVNYANLEHPLLKYFGDMNMLMFPKYFLNITRFISNDMLQDHLGRTMVAGIVDMSTDLITTPLTSFLPAKLMDIGFMVSTPLIQPVSSFTGLGTTQGSDLFAIDNFLPINVRM